MIVEVSSRGKSKMRKLPHGAEQTSKGGTVWVRTLALRQKLREFFGVREEGSQLVEMAVVAPLLLIILTGMASFGMALYSEQQLGLAASQAVQAVSLDTSQITDPCATLASDVSNLLGSTWKTSTLQFSLTVYKSSSSSTSYPSSGTTVEGSFSCSTATPTAFQPLVLTVSYPYSWFPIFTWSKYGTTFTPTGNLSTTQAAMVQ